MNLHHFGPSWGLGPFGELIKVSWVQYTMHPDYDCENALLPFTQKL